MTSNIDTRTEYNCNTRSEKGFWNRICSHIRAAKCENVPIVTNSSDKNTNVDSVTLDKTSKTEDTNLEIYYDRIAEILEKNGISVEEAKKAKLLEKLVLAEGINEENFEDIKQALEIVLGEISLKHFGRSIFYAIKNLFGDDFDIISLIEETQEELWNNKTQTSIIGRRHYNTQGKLEKHLSKSGYMADGENVEQGLNNLVLKCQNGEIDQKEVARVFVDIANSKDIDKSTAVRLIKGLAANDRALAIAVMQNIDNLSAEELSGIDLEFVKEIHDIAYGTENGVEMATSVTQKAFSEMVEEDMYQAVEYVNCSTNAFYENNSDMVACARAKAARGETLTAEEQACLISDELYCAINSAGVVGTSQNTNISPNVASEIMHDILNNVHNISDKYNISFEDDVLTNIANYAINHPEYFKNMPLSEFSKILDKITDGKFSKMIQQYKNNLSYKQENTETNNKSKENICDDKKYTDNNNSSVNIEPQNGKNHSKNTNNTETTTSTNPIIVNTQEFQITAEPKTAKDFNTSDINECAKSSEGIKNFFNNNSDIKAITAAYTKLKSNNAAIINEAKRRYETIDAYGQEQILVQTGFKGIGLISISRNKTLKDMVGQYTNNALVQATEKEIENREKYNPEYQKYFEDENSKKSCV